MNQHIVKQIIGTSLFQLKNAYSLVGTYLFANPYLITCKQHIAYPLIDLSQKLQINIIQFDKLLLLQRIPPTIFNCEIIKKTLIYSLSYTNTTFSEQIIFKKIQNLAESFNDKIRQLNENDLQEKQIRALLINTRNILQACEKQIQQKSDKKLRENQTFSKIIDYLL